MENKIKYLKKKSLEYRKVILEIIYNSGAGHTGGSLSCIDILNVLYNEILEISPTNFNLDDRNHYIHSKGHSVEALYAVLCDKGFFKRSELDTLNNFNSHFIGHPTKKINGIEHNTGALGHGFSVAVGIAISKKINHSKKKVYTILGDGELSEGSVWEAFTSANKYKLDNLIMIIDRNGLQITGKTESVNPIEPLEEKLQSFGFKVKSINGNDTTEIFNTLKAIPFESDKPNAIIANTVKGYGISFIENEFKWHHKVPNDQEFQLAIDELNQKLNSYE